MTSGPLSPESLLAAYAGGFFPMAPRRDSAELRWYSPDPRAILPLESFHVPKRLARELKAQPFTIRHDSAFDQVIAACADTPRTHEKGTWISRQLEAAYLRLHQIGQAHSVECWRDETLVGGLYGVSIGGAFFGESMFSRVSGASKAALVALVEHLTARGFTLLDTQFVNAHLVQFGVVEIPREEYLARLRQAICQPIRFR